VRPRATGEPSALPLGARVAAIDIGTNTVLLTVAERVPAGGDLAGELQVIGERHAITRLGQGVDRQGTLDPGAIDRTLACLELYRQETVHLGAGRVLCVGTSALRDAASGEAFVARASDILGCPVEVVSGAREAELTFRGALSSLDPSRANTEREPIDAASLVLAFDIGGGSTEIVLGTAAGEVQSAASVNVGSVRLFERYGDSSWDEATRAVIAALPPPLPSSPDLVIGIAGTMTTLWTLAYGMPFEESSAAERPLRTERIARLATELRALPVEARQHQLGIDAGRADVIPFGALVASEILRFIGASQVRVTGRGVRYGLLLETLAG